jgi:threonylcarbamoyladenosine tRNA methylthiotransferase MtaB
MPTVALHTLGCKLNYAETSALARKFQDRGYRVVPFGAEADVCVVNTCTVTAAADRECRQIIRRARRSSPRARVVVTGCYAQLAPEDVASIPGVQLVLGTREKFDILRHLDDARTGGGPRVLVSDTAGAEDFGPASSSDGGRTRAFLKIQDGCDYPCTYCTIPLARGASRSHPPELCLAQARELAAAGFREIVLTGVNVGDYGRKDGTDLLALLRLLTGVEGLRRIRISSIEPNLLTDEIIAFTADSEVMAPHFHIPLQSGSAEVLGMMRRRYSPADFAGRVEAAAARIPDCGIGVDVITGFPGETDAHFAEGTALLGDLPFTYLHVFTYSERPDTPAAALPGSVPVQIRRRRTALLRDISARRRREFYRSLVGSTQEVLLEAQVADGLRYGYSGNYARLGVPAGAGDENSVLTVRVTDARADHCTARPLTERGEA